MLKGYFIQYKFVLPETTKHSSYTYQKLFRALYGYTQDVHKSSGKNYKYHRPGVLSGAPYIRAGKNCVIIPQPSFQNLVTFFKTGKNPTHNWETKGEWKAVYYMNEKNIEPSDAVKALEEMLDRLQVSTKSKKKSVLEELQRAKENSDLSRDYLLLLANEAKKIASHEWFKEVYSSSPKLKEFKTLYDAIKI